jgi:tetratricopeptide (TPR) repeat protein
MDRIRRVGAVIGAIALAATLLAACETPPPEIPEGLSQAELFQLGQEALTDRRYEDAVSYYETFLERYPDDTENRVAARYEIAFVYYKQGEFEKAKRRFEELLAQYEEADAQAAAAESQEADGGEQDTDEDLGGNGQAAGQATGQGGAGAQQLPQWPRVLAQKILEKIEVEQSYSGFFDNPRRTIDDRRATGQMPSEEDSQSEENGEEDQDGSEDGASGSEDGTSESGGTGS